MPIYEYGCKECNHTEEIYFKTSSEEEPKECPKCKSLDYNRIPSSFGFDVPNGKMYLGKRDWKNKLTNNQQSEVLLGSREPY